jgi:hypothetical protein
MGFPFPTFEHEFPVITMQGCSICEARPKTLCPGVKVKFAKSCVLRVTRKLLPPTPIIISSPQVQGIKVVTIPPKGVFSPPNGLPKNAFVLKTGIKKVLTMIRSATRERKIRDF